jgi:3-dehydroquinate synthase
LSIKISSNIRDYDVHFCESSSFLFELDQHAPYCYTIDETVWGLYGNTLLKHIPDASRINVPISEDLKTLQSVQMLYDQLISFSAKRNLTLISIGGGILQDISGFVASSLYRGIKWIFVPTTLLSQADSCIGSKTSLNYGGFKNLIGTFYPPNEIFIYPEFLKTQNDIDFYSGLGEVIKLHLMDGPHRAKELLELFPQILKRDSLSLISAIKNSLLIKKAYITDDEFDEGKRNLLNFGHCFGHALETTSNFIVPHGQAVLLGIFLANIVSVKRGILSPETQSYIANKFLLPGLVVKLQQNFFYPQSIIDAMKKDKKRTGSELPLVMMNDNFNVFRINDLTTSEAAIALTEGFKLIENIRTQSLVE